jgi:hypothetical protein
LRKALELVAKKCGIVVEDQELNNITLQQYLDIHKKPMAEESLDAIMKLSEVAEERKKKKKVSKRKISEDSAKKTEGKKEKNGKKGSAAALALA